MIQAFAILDSLVLLGIAVFQVLLAAGKPWGKYAWGGQHLGVVPVRFRAGSVGSAALHVMWTVVVLVEGGVAFGALRSTATEVLAWVLVGTLVLGVLANGASRSRKERLVWTPVAAVACVLSAVVAWVD